MEQHDLIQNSPEWHEHRRTHYNASDVPAMLGISPYKTRTQLLDEMVTGIYEEVDEATQRRFDDGHRFEELARPMAEAIIGKTLYPVVGSQGKYSASFDGLTSDDEINFEHKTLNKGLIEVFDNGLPLPELYTSQIEQQMMVSGAKRTLFMASKWKKIEGEPIDEIDDGRTYGFVIDDSGKKIYYVLVDMRHCWVEPDPVMRSRIIAGWEQLEKDKETHTPTAASVSPVGVAPESLPSLHIELMGMVTSSNLDEFRATAMMVIDSVNTDLQTDQDFANAKKAVKWCSDVETRLKSAKQHALSQTASIDELFRVIDEVMEHARQTRLTLNKIVSERDKALRHEIVLDGRDALAEHIFKLNERIGKPYMPPVTVEFAAAIKGKSSFDKMREAVSTVLRNAKFDADKIAEKIELNIATLREHADGYQALFPDTAQLVHKANDDLLAVIKSRIAEHKEAEAKRLEGEREKIRQEEEAKIREEEERKRREEEERQKAEAEELAWKRGVEATKEMAECGRAEGEAYQRRQQQSNQMGESRSPQTGQAVSPQTGESRTAHHSSSGSNHQTPQERIAEYLFNNANITMSSADKIASLIVMGKVPGVAVVSSKAA